MTKMQIVIAFGSALIGAIVGGVIAIYGSLLAVRRIEYYRLRLSFRNIIQDFIIKVNQHNQPWILVDDTILDDAFRDIIQFAPHCKREGLKNKWNEYRYDKREDGTIPDEYETSGTISARKLIIERLHKLTSMI